MKATIIGSGTMGRGIGTRLVKGGAEVELVDHDREQARALAADLDGAGDGSAAAAESEGRVSGDLVILAIPYGAAEEVIESAADSLDGKIVVDITNPVDVETMDGLVTPSDSSAAEEIAKLAPEGATVLKAFNTTFGGTLVEGDVSGQPLQVLIAGDDDDAKGKLAGLVEAGGMQAIDVGPLRRARQLEQLGLLHMAIQEPLGTGFGSAVRFVW